MSRTEIAHISKAPTKSGALFPVRVLNMTMTHARWWHDRIQPVIDDDPERRADKEWHGDGRAS